MSKTASTSTSQLYVDRQFIVVLPDDVVEAARAAEAEAAKSDKPIDWKSVVSVVVKSMTSSWVSSLIDVSSAALAAWAQARQSGLDVRQLSKTEARDLQFPPGHPRTGVLYVGHPALPSVYYTVASFHRVAFEHKFSEAITLLMHLGATEIRVEHLRGWSQQFAGRMSVAIPAKDASLEAKADSKSATTLLYEATLRGKAEATLPSSLVWYHHEPTWQAIANGRIEFGLSQFALTVNYEDDFGVNAGLKTSAIKAGLELGGNFEAHEATTWRLDGKFLD